METRNSLIVGGRNATQIVSDAQAYIAARLAVHPWKIVLCTCIPDGTGVQATINANNAVLDAANAAFVSNYRMLGAIACADIRAHGSGWASMMPDYNLSTFAAAVTANYYNANADNIHPGDAGFAAMVPCINGALARLMA